MGTRRRSPRPLPAAVAAAIIAVSLAVCAGWALRVPFFQNPDEIAHADYVFAIVDAGAPLRAATGTPLHVVAAQTRYLLNVAGYRGMRYDPAAAAPPGYGSHAFFGSVDARAPKPSGTMPVAGAPIPYVATFYPAAYYVLDAAAAGTVLRATASLVAAFFAARLVGDVLFAITLIAGYGITRELRMKPRDAALLLLALGLLPLASWTFAAIQPDDATTALFELSLYGMLRFKRTARPRDGYALLATLAALAFVKFHYAALATATALLTTRHTLGAAFGARKYVAAAALAFVPATCIVLARRFTLVGASFALPGPAHDSASGVGERVLATLAGAYWRGETFASFWYHFGVRSGTVFAPPILDAVAVALGVASLGTFVLVVARQSDVLRRLVALARRRGARAALRFVANDPLLVSYVLVTAFLLGFSALTAGDLTPQGRYWLPVLLPTIVLASRAIPRRAPRRAAAYTACLALWAAFALAGAPSALRAMNADYYHAPRLPTHELGTLDEIRDADRALESGARVTRGRLLTATGAVVDSSRGAPALDVRATVGADSFRADTGNPSPSLARIFNDETLRDSGFRVAIPTATLAPGPHTIVFRAIEPRAPAGLAFASFEIEVVPR